MSSGLKIRIPARRSTLVNSGPSSSNQPLNSVENSEPQSEMDDVEMEENDAEFLPGRKYTARSGNIRNPPERWVQWETDFLEKCFETTRYPDVSLRSEWALNLTEKRLKTIKPSSEDKENLVKIWYSHYNRRLSNWFKNRKAKLRREGDALVEESPIASPRLSHKAQTRSVTVVKKYTVPKNHRYCEELEDNEEEFRDDSPESEEGQSVSDEREDNLDNTVDEEGGSRLDILAHMASLQPPLPATTSACRDEPMSETQPRAPLAFPASTTQNEFLDKYDDDVIYGATLLMQLKMGYKG